MIRRQLLIFSFALLSSWAISLQAAPPLRLLPVATDLSQPLFLTYAPGDSTRLFVVERTGAIRVIHYGVLLDQPFLDISSKIDLTGNEQGLLGLAFHPDYRDNGYFYVNYTQPNEDASVTSRYSVSSQPNVADASSEMIMLQIPKPRDNHNGGMLAFGPDGYLYVGIGDGGGAGDPGDNGQDSTTLLGKILRIDVDRINGTLVPTSNPYVGRTGWRGEIWDLGLRNPWRFSFDRETGDLYIADVGQGTWEEINYQPASDNSGRNFGWRLKEGDQCYIPPANCEGGLGLVDPIYQYDHEDGCSVTGGYVYRGCAIPELQGTYIFGDFCTGDVWSFEYSNGVTQFESLTSNLGTDSLNISSFGEDARGELYIVSLTGSVYRISPEGQPACEVSLCCLGVTGDLNLSGAVDLPDLNLMVSYFAGPNRPTFPCPEAANVSGSGLIDLTDLSLLAAFLSADGVVLPDCP